MPPPPPSKLRRKDPRRHEGLCLPSLPPSLLPRPVWHPSLSAQVGHSPLAVPRRRRIKSSLRHSIKKAFAARRREGERKIRSTRGWRGKGRTARARAGIYTLFSPGGMQAGMARGQRRSVAQSVWVVGCQIMQEHCQIGRERRTAFPLPSRAQTTKESTGQREEES